jgi:O-antigen ligase
MVSLFAYNDSLPSKKKGFVIYYALLAYIVSLYIKNAPVISNGLMFSILLLGILSISRGNYLTSFSKNRINLGILLFFIFQIISVLFSSDKVSGFDIISLRLPLLILPLAFCFIEFEEKTWRNILLFYAITTALASLAGFMYGARIAIHENNSAYYYNDNISELLLGKQAAYFGLYVNVAILFIVYIIGSNYSDTKGYRFILFASLVWLIFINYMLASKMSTISLGIILISMAFARIIRNRKKMEGVILVFGLLISGVILNELFPKTIGRFKTITQTDYRFDNTNPENSLDDKFDANKWSSGSTRMALWTCGKEIFIKHPVFGTGLGDIRNSLKEKYTEKHFLYALNTNKNLHCQYFDIAVSMGIVGLILFLFTFFFYPLKIFMQQKQDLAISVFICVGLCLLTENMFDRYQGEELIAFILPLSMKVFNGKENTPIDYHSNKY